MVFTDSPPVPPSKRLQTRASYERNGFPQFAAVTNKENSQIIKQAVPEIHEEGDEIRFGILTGKALSVWLEFIDETGKNVFVCKCKLSLALLYFVDMFTNKLKTRFNGIFTGWF